MRKSFVVADAKTVKQGISCTWYDPGDTDGMFETTCGNAFMFTDGGPKDNGFNFCPYCGCKIDDEVTNG